MATKTTRKAAKKTVQKRAAARPGKNAMKSKKLAKGPSKVSPLPSHTPTPGLDGWITHTELASNNPAATRAWCAKALGWAFKPSLSTPAGEYHLFSYSDKGGGGIRSTRPAELPGSTPTVHVADVHAAFARALQAGAQALSPPECVMPGVTIALVRAPGGVAIGLAGP